SPLKNWIALTRDSRHSAPLYAATLNGLQVHLLQTGIGPLRAEASLIQYLDHRPRPSLAINFGLCGALLPDLSTGDIVVPSSIVMQGKAPVETSLHHMERLTAIARDKSIPCRQAAHLTTDHVLASAFDKSRAAGDTDSISV